MKLIGVFLLFVTCLPEIIAQDVLVLRKDEKEIKCRILLLNDTLVQYRLWTNADTTVYSVRKYDVLSFMLDRKSQNAGIVRGDETDDPSDAGLLGEYRTGEIVRGFVIRLNNDTIEGFIRAGNVASNQDTVVFTDMNGAVVRYTPNDLKGYGYLGIRYEKIKLPAGGSLSLGNRKREHTCFVHRVVAGPSSFYRFYTLHFEKSMLKSYAGNPPHYLGKLKRAYIITAPDGRAVFTKGRTLKGALNRIYYPYKEYHSRIQDSPVKQVDLPGIVTGFNDWYSNRP